jgi:dTDP-4-dehydrorhamnose reductase
MGAEPQILILGGSGLLGEALAADLSRRGLRFVAPPRERFDLERTAGMRDRVETFTPRAVVNAAAFTDVAKAETPSHRPAAYRSNRDGPAALAAACRRLGVPLVHVSTDYVFDGEQSAPYVESDLARPTQVYGRSKLEGEREVLVAHSDAIVARTSTLFGPGRRRRPHYVDAILRQAPDRPRLEVVRLPVSSPTYAPDLAGMLLDLLESEATGIVHTVNRGECSRLELATTTVKLAGLAGTTEVVERPEPPTDLVRPDYSVLDPSLCERIVGRRIRPWHEALREYLDRHGRSD